MLNQASFSQLLYILIASILSFGVSGHLAAYNSFPQRLCPLSHCRERAAGRLPQGLQWPSHGFSIFVLPTWPCRAGGNILLQPYMKHLGFRASCTPLNVSTLELSVKTELGFLQQVKFRCRWHAPCLKIPPCKNKQIM